MEGSFADAATHHGFKRARWRRLWRQRIQDLLIATVQNLRTLIRHARAPRAGVCSERLDGEVTTGKAFAALITIVPGLLLAWEAPDARELMVSSIAPLTASVTPTRPSGNSPCRCDPRLDT